MKASLQSILSTFHQVFPGRFFVIAVLAALLFLVIDAIRTRSRKRGLLTAYAVCILILFFLPPVKSLIGSFMRDGEVYWRVLWLFPYTFIIATAVVRLTELIPNILPKLICCAAAAVTIFFAGRLVYNPEVFQKATNREKVPDIVLETISVLQQNSKASGNSYMNLVAPVDVMNKVRQCDASIHIPMRRVFFPLKRDLAEPTVADIALTFANQKAYDPETVPEELKSLHTNYALIPNSYGAAPSMTESGWNLLYERDGWQIWYEPDVT